MPDGLQKFLSAAKIVVEKSNAEKGCLMYTLFQGVDNPYNFFIYEEYENMEAVDFHRTAEHYQTFFADIEDILTEPKIAEVF